MNLVGCWFGAMPCCHGAGGLAAQVRLVRGSASAQDRARACLARSLCSPARICRTPAHAKPVDFSIATQARFGARTGAAPIFLGLLKLALGLLFGSSLLTLLKSFPAPLLGELGGRFGS